MIQISSSQDAEYNKWFDSWEQRVARALERAAIVEASFTLAGMSVQLTAGIGLLHKLPNIYIHAAVPIRRGHDKFHLARIAFNCNGFDLTFMESSIRGLRECPSCNNEATRKRDALIRVRDAILRSVHNRNDNDPDSGVVVAGSPEPKQPSPGAMTEWFEP